MTNIWGFAYQSLSVSLAAAVLLIVKWALKDKLSPRWQYGVWAVLALRALIPASLRRGIVPSLGLYLEALKSAAELDLGSAYSSAFESIYVAHPLPYVDSAPASLTDWLFIAYAAGAALTLAWYALQYARLRLLLRRGGAPGPETERVIADVAGEYGLRPCRAVSVPGLSTAFVCGVLRPVLAVPEGAAPERKVVLHELLHLKYFDAAQGVFWCVLKALHWCNPFMRYVFNRVGNDMESLCDQRVLERLEGEERREYGRILLDMANSAYPRAPGTSSISNGAANISRRIEAIARFKLYPRGMALVSVCAAVMLGAMLLSGAMLNMPNANSYAAGTRDAALESLLGSRLNRCTTVAGALDTYTKGLLLDNPVMLAMSTSEEKQKLWYNELLGGDITGRTDLDDFGVGYPEENTSFFLNLRRSGGELLCEISIRVPHEGTDSPLSTADMVIIPAAVSREKGVYVVRERGEAYLLNAGSVSDGGARPLLYRGSAGCADGTIYAGVGTYYSVGGAKVYNEDASYATIYGGGKFDPEANPSASFSGAYLTSWICLECETLAVGESRPYSGIGMQYKWLDDAGEDYEFNDDRMLLAAGAGNQELSPNGSGLVMGYAWPSTGRVESSLEIDAKGFPPEYPGALAVRVYHDLEPVEELMIEMEAVL